MRLKLVCSALFMSYLCYEYFIQVRSYDEHAHVYSLLSSYCLYIRLSVTSLAFLIKEGYEDRIVIAHDIHTKNRLTKYGGHGYSHILNNIVPKMLSRGISQKQVDKILIDNPKQWLTFKQIQLQYKCYVCGEFSFTLAIQLLSN